jgi:hypothetical protein
LSQRQLRIDHRFHGPPDSGNGGYAAGLVATALGGSECVVTLHRPPPLDRLLDLRATPEDAELLDGEVRIASAVRERLDHDVPAPPAFAEAVQAQDRFTGLRHHRFPSCFVCGPDRKPGDGLAIYPGDIGGRVAGTWTPGADLASAAGIVGAEFIWAALDCPGYFAVEERAGFALLGRIAAKLERAVRAGEPLIVTGWGIESVGRKHTVGTALHDSGGSLVASARATWITIGVPGS